MKNFNKREKTANLLFKVVEYGVIAFGINALLPGSHLNINNILIGVGTLSLLYIIALYVTPEKP